MRRRLWKYIYLNLVLVILALPVSIGFKKEWIALVPYLSVILTLVVVGLAIQARLLAGDIKHFLQTEERRDD